MPTLVRHGKLRPPAAGAGQSARASGDEPGDDRPLAAGIGERAGMKRRRTARSPVRASIPVRTFSGGDDPPPGYAEAYLVAHGGPVPTAASCRRWWSRRRHRLDRMGARRRPPPWCSASCRRPVRRPMPTRAPRSCAGNGAVLLANVNCPLLAIENCTHGRLSGAGQVPTAKECSLTANMNRGHAN